MFEAITHVVRFELIRTLTWARVLIWAVLCLFPTLLVTTLRFESEGNLPEEGIIFVCYALVPQISCMLGLLLWATPAVGSEIEAQTWIHIAMRPRGRIALALGKYAVAVIWTGSYGLVSSVLVSVLSGAEEVLPLMFSLIVLSLLASFSYAALYLLIGATFFNRGTIVAVLYSLTLEGFVSWIPATINQITISYRLRTLISNWTVIGEIEDSTANPILFGTEAPWLTVLIVMLYTVTLLSLACLAITRREFPVQSDT